MDFFFSLENILHNDERYFVVIGFIGFLDHMESINFNN